ncbi:MAG: bifunctional UDP-N-acetylglucosamine diphosphorylase/glucosamine-1-phosphate N-acetyltransferase GlmU [Actinobacteria bacterium]|nr:bifunctional UDP-N-acetylglucosamine diphosphorylase/glucosamine-1-phosphate N-acetyltransferase GlmU [Actinomycetota bacterium]
MADAPLAAVVMAGGLGTRMRSTVPKHFHSILGRRMVDWVIETGRESGADPLVVIASPAGRDEFAQSSVTVAVQETPLGTGDAVRCAQVTLAGFDGDVLVLSGDTPLLTASLLRELVETHRREQAAVTILSAVPPDPRVYGRIVRDADGAVLRIAEGTDATDEERRIGEINSSIYVFRSDALWPALDQLQPKNVQGELYLTDTIEILVAQGAKVAAHIARDYHEVDGVNTRVELAHAGAVLRDRINEEHMLAGVTLSDPASTWIEPSVRIEPDVVIHPFTILRGATSVATGAEIHAHTVAIDAQIGANASVGPFCYLRPGTILGDSSKAGTYVEIKNASVGDRTKVPHLSYIGDASIGEDTNIAAGAITANFPHRHGEPKGRTTIGDNVRTGIHNGFVAPVEVGDGAWIAAGSVITTDVPSDALGIARARQENKEGYAARQRDE